MVMGGFCFLIKSKMFFCFFLVSCQADFFRWITLGLLFKKGFFYGIFTL